MGLVLIKLPESRLADLTPAEVQGISRNWPDDKVVIIPLETDVVIGKTAREELIKFRDEINAALKGG